MFRLQKPSQRSRTHLTKAQNCFLVHMYACSYCNSLLGNVGIGVDYLIITCLQMLMDTFNFLLVCSFPTCVVSFPLVIPFVYHPFTFTLYIESPLFEFSIDCVEKFQLVEYQKPRASKPWVTGGLTTLQQKLFRHKHWFFEPDPHSWLKQEPEDLGHKQLYETELKS